MWGCLRKLEAIKHALHEFFEVHTTLLKSISRCESKFMLQLKTKQLKDWAALAKLVGGMPRQNTIPATRATRSQLSKMVLERQAEP
jgi:uncharacterized protein with NAD-binding domain and iron-sulfur cluster